VALAGLSFAQTALRPSAAAVNGDPVSQVILGHHGCVLPRLLTLLAAFLPEARFVTPSDENPAGERFPPEYYREAPQECGVARQLPAAAPAGHEPAGK